MRGENRSVLEVPDKRGDRTNVSLNVIVEQEDQRMRGKLESSVASFTEAQVLFVPCESQPRSPRLSNVPLLLKSLLAEPCGAFVGAAIVDDNDLGWNMGFCTVVGRRRDNRRQELLE
jgi:hypothetical protein